MSIEDIDELIDNIYNQQYNKITEEQEREQDKLHRKASEALLKVKEDQKDGNKPNEKTKIIDMFKQEFKLDINKFKADQIKI